MLIFAWRARRRRTWPTSSPWNSRTPTPPLSSADSTGSPVVVVVVVVAVPGATPVAGRGAVVGAVACTSNNELSPALLADGAVSEEAGFGAVSAAGAGCTMAIGLESGAGAGGLTWP